MEELSVCNVSISSVDGLYSLNDLHKAAIAAGENARSKEPAKFMGREQTAQVIKLLEEENKNEILITPKQRIKNKSETVQNQDSLKTSGKVVVAERGRYGGSYVCKELVYLYAMWISPEFMVRVIRTFDAVARGDIKTALKTAGTEASRIKLERLEQEAKALMHPWELDLMKSSDRDEFLDHLKKSTYNMILDIIGKWSPKTERQYQQFVEYVADYRTGREWIVEECLKTLVLTGRLEKIGEYEYRRIV